MIPLPTGKRPLIGLTFVLLCAMLFGMIAAPKPAHAQAPETGFPLLREIVTALIRATTEATGLTEAELLLEVLSGTSLEKLVTEKGGDFKAVKAAVKSAVTERIETAVTAGTLTQAQSETLIASLDRAISRVTSGNIAEIARRAGGGDTPRQALNAFLTEIVQAVATSLEMTPEDLLRELVGGKTLAAVIKEKGGELSAIQAAVKPVVVEAIRKAAAEGKLTQETADAITARLDALLERVLNEVIKRGEARKEEGTENRFLRLFELRYSTALIAQTAKATGLTQRALLPQLREGKSLAQIATEKGVDPATIIAAATTDITRQIERLSNGETPRLKAEDKTTLLEELPAKLTDLMNSTTLLRLEGVRR
ncbi:MAG TPA: hypothetical protein PLD47_12215 [Aggregatilineales bacterium]|nr:hypothetical protein [Anaerolineales bacterium]HRE48481.1 hypothetical protein [Aggregatilineales bacterium]